MKITPEDILRFKENVNFDVDGCESLSACTDYFSACGLLIKHVEALEARVKELEGIAHKCAVKGLQDAAELDRLKAQKSIAFVAISKGGFDKGSKIIDYYSEDIQQLAVGTKIYAEPRPAVLTEDEAGNPAGFIDWYEREFALEAYKGSLHVTNCKDAYRAGMKAAGGEIAE